MSRFLVEPENISETQISLKEKESHHIRNVLRFKEGDEVFVFDGQGNQYRCRIDSLDKKSSLLSILEKLATPAVSKSSITLAHSVTKGERFDWVVEKATELGVKKIVPFLCERVNVKLNEESKAKKQARWLRLAQAASKQCGRNRLPEVSPVLKWEELPDSFKEYDLVLLAYELESGTGLKSTLRQELAEKPVQHILAVVGPEGGFSAREVEAMIRAGARSVSLGENILRTETAAIAMTAMIQYELQS